MNQGCKKYIPFTPISLPDRTWPDKRIEKAPIWCSVDLRDGNQALVTPMNLQEKLDFFKLLIALGFKEIEVGFPSASETEYEILRALIDGHYIPDDVTIQVLVQAREHLHFHAPAQGGIQKGYAGHHRHRGCRRQARA